MGEITVFVYLIKLFAFFSSYLSEAIEALDEQHEIAAAYMPTVLDNLAEQVEKAIIILKSSSEPDKQHQQQLNMLRKLIRAKCK